MEGVITRVVSECFPTPFLANMLICMPMFFRPASKGVDGDDTPDVSISTCASTNPDTHPWFVVDLGIVYDITGVALTNREQAFSE